MPPIFNGTGDGALSFRDGLSASRVCCEKSGITNVTELVGWHSHRNKMLRGIKQVGSNCSEWDTFLLYCTGLETACLTIKIQGLAADEGVLAEAASELTRLHATDDPEHVDNLLHAVAQKIGPRMIRDLDAV